MNPSQRTQLAAALLALLGVIILVIGVIEMLAPPIITGLGFFVIAWALAGAGGQARTGD